MPSDSGRQAGTIESYEGRGVWVPEGLTARDIREGAKLLEKQFDVAPFVSDAMACAVLERAALCGKHPSAVPDRGCA